MNARYSKNRRGAASLLRVTVLASLLTSLAALPPGRYVGIENKGATGLQLELPSIQDAVYEVQAKSNLTSAVWKPIGTVTGRVGNATVPVSMIDDDTQFIRVQFPKPTVSAGEPALFAQNGGGSSLYVSGQYFYPGDQIFVGGVELQNVVFLSHNQLRGDLPPGLSPGRHTVHVRSGQGGALLAELTDAVHVVDPLVNPDSLLQGPPADPPASPMGLWLSKKGYDYYQMQSDIAAAASPGTDALSEEYIKRKLNKISFVAPPDNGKGISQPGIKLFDDSVAAVAPPSGNGKGISEKGLPPSAMSAGFEIVDGKKGLNAVNVKLARMAADTGNDTFMVEELEIAVDYIDRYRGLGSSGQDGVSFFSGDVQDCVVDLAVPGRGLDFIWARTYHSRLGRTGSSTNGWTFSYDLHLQPLGGDLLVHNGTGRADRYVLQTNGVYTCPEFFCEGALNANVFRLTFADTGYWEFRSLSASTAPGKLDRIVDRNGNTVALSYDPSGRLSGVVDDLGRNYTVGYDTAGRLASVSDFSGRTVSYVYDGNGDLTACVSPPVTGTPNGNNFPNGKTNSYVYTSGFTVAAENHLLLACVDGMGQTNTQYGYDLALASPSYLRCTSIQRGDHPPMRLTYQPQTPTPSNRFAAWRCVVNDPVGNVSELYYDSRGRGIEKKDIRRRATPGEPVTNTASLSAEKLRFEDPEYTVTRWSWNNDSLCTSATAPGGQVVSYTYQGDLEPSTPARKRADCRVVRETAASPVDLDGDGAADVTERVWTYEYDPRFGSTPCKGWDGSVKGKKIQAWVKDCYDGRPRGIELPNVVATDGGLGSGGGCFRKEKKGRVRESPSKAPLGVGVIAAGTDEPGISPASGVLFSAGACFATSAIDPRGNVTEADYDEQGNCRALIVPATRTSTGAITFSFVHDLHGQLTAITNAPDANGRGRVDTFTYSQGRVIACVVDAGADGLALATTFEYDSRGNLTRCVDPRNNDWLYTYNSLDQCVRAQSPTNISARCTTGFFYDANDNLVQRVTQLRSASDDQLVACTNRASYDALHRLTEVALAVDGTHALTNRFVYDGNDQCVQILGGDAVSGVDPFHAVAFEYDTCGLLYREVAAPNSTNACTTQYDYDPNGLLTRVIEGLEDTPSITTLAYDGFAGAIEVEYEKWEGRTSLPRRLVVLVGGADRPSRVTDPMGNVTTFHYDANDNMTVARQFGQLIDVPGSVGNLRLAESRFEYDHLDRCTVQRDLHFNPATQSPVGDGECTTAFAYAPNGTCTGVTNDLGGVTTFAYDTVGRFHSVSASGSLLACFRDGAGNVTSVTQTDTSALGGPPQSFTRTFAYDSRNRCFSTTDGAGKTNSCAYDSLDRVVRSTDAAGTQTFHSYDLLDRLTLTVRDLDGNGVPSGEVSSGDLLFHVAWSPSSDRLLSTTDSHGNTTSYAYDSRDRCVAVTCADGTKQSVVWSPRSNLILETDANGCVITNTYNLNDCLGKADIAFGLPNATLAFEAFSYDGCGRLTVHSNDTCSGSSAYDSLGNCVSDTLNGLATLSTYDALGNRLSLTYPGGRVLTYAYDASGSCTNIAEASSSIASFLYNGVDRLARVTYGNGLSSTFEYDGLDGVQNAPGDFGFGQISQLVHASTNGTSLMTSRFGWNQKENKGARIIFPSGSDGNTNVLTLAYDRADRLVRSTVTEGTTTIRDTTYSLDRMGSRTNVTGAAGYSGAYTLSSTIPPADFQMSQYTATPGDSRAYDENGNLVFRSSFSDGAVTVYSYDHADRLVAVHAVVDGGTGIPSTNLVASYLYDALGRRASKTVSVGGMPPSTRQYGYDGSCVIEEWENSAVAQSYVHTSGLQDKVTENDTVLQMRIGTHDYFVLADDQGNALALVDASGQPVEFYDYDDYGAVTFLTSDGTPTGATSSAVGNPYCWGGLRLDAETGLHNDDGGGYYEPQTGRATRAKVKTVKDLSSLRVAGGPSSSAASKHYITIPHDLAALGGSSGNNPWSGGTPLGMAKGTVKFFNTPKGFGRAANQQKLDSVLNLIR